MSTPQPEFENTSVGDLKRRIWNASDEELDAILDSYGIPSPGEMETPGTYLQMTHPDEIKAKRLKNDVVLIPLGCTELHGPHSVAAQDTLQVNRLCEGVRRYTAERGYEVGLVQSPWLYGVHPKHHVGLIGTIPISAHTLENMLVDVMFGLWSLGYRKMIFVNNHAQHWVIANALDAFGLRYPELPYLAMIMDWCAAMHEFFRTEDRGGPFETDFVHADEAETSVAMLLAPETIDMSRAVDTEGLGYLPDVHFNKSASQRSRPHIWWNVRGNTPLEMTHTPVGIVGKATLADPRKARQAVAGALEYLVLLIDDILEALPPGEVPPIEDVTLFNDETAAYLKEPEEEGYLNPYRIWRPFA